MCVCVHIKVRYLKPEPELVRYELHVGFEIQAKPTLKFTYI